MHEYYNLGVNSDYVEDYYYENKYKNYSEKSKSTNSVKQLSSTSTSQTNNKKTNVPRNSSFVIGQKLRESKWFTREEIKIFSSVIETGFIVETKNEKAQISWGIALWNTGFEKSKNPDQISIYFLSECKNGYKVESKQLLEFWQPGSVIKINNYNDKEETPNSEEIVKNKISYAKKNKLNWHNIEHFIYWCRYLPLNKNNRMQAISGDVKWFTTKINRGLLMLRGRKKSTT